MDDLIPHVAPLELCGNFQSEASTMEHESDQFLYPPLTAANRVRFFRICLVGGENGKVTTEDPGARQFELEMIDTDLATKPKYLAVSYTWGKHEHRHMIRVKGGGTLSLSDRVVGILERFLPLDGSEQTGLMWLDQICIDQTNEDEKEHQIRIMRDIYSLAACVFLVLESADHSTDRLMDYISGLPLIPKTNLRQCWRSRSEKPISLLETWTPPGIDQTIVYTFCQKSLRDAFTKLLADRVFERVWIYQEVVAAKKLVLCGRQLFIEWDIFAAAIDILSWLKDQNSDVGLDPPASVQVMIDDRIANLCGRPTDWRLLHVRAQGLFGATDLRDMTLALTTFQDFYSSIPPQASTTPSVAARYTTAARAMISVSASLDVFSAIAKPSHAPAREREAMPSWVPDWSRPRPSIPLLWPMTSTAFDSAKGRPHRGRTSSGGAHADGFPREILTVHGRVIDTVGAIVDHVYGEPLSVHDPLTREAIEPWFRAGLAAVTASTPMSDTGERGYFAGGLRLAGEEEEEEEEDEVLPEAILDELLFMWQWEAEIVREDGGPLHHVGRPHWLSFFPRTHGSLKAGLRVFRRWVRICTGRRIVFGRKARGLGMVPAAVEAGDVVCVLHGSKVPVVLRRFGRRYRVVGQCYWHGWMRGRSVDWGQDEGDEFELI